MFPVFWHIGILAANFQSKLKCPQAQYLKRQGNPQELTLMVLIIKTAGKPKLLPSAGSIESGIRSTSYDLPFKPFDSKYSLNTHTLQVPPSTIQNVLQADDGKKSFIIN
ncbi:MAG: hypothetical protein EZS28_030948 [Streblomastix strix]|uniref:Uncharacterized protein n=1 Tax=Streblomastix strix TaxID=222440 RepID=A0A5J4UTF7_9EUKA|nr:MAG: hypothetical protein EZS28_030948 [Streblomastix strix]